MIGMYKYDASKLKTTPLVELTPEVLSYDASTNVLTIEKQYSGAKVSGQNITFFANNPPEAPISTVSGTNINVFGGLKTNTSGSSYVSIFGGANATVDNSYNVSAIHIDSSTLGSNTKSAFTNIVSTDIYSSNVSAFSAIQDSTIQNTYLAGVIAGSNISINGAYYSAIIGSGSVAVESPTRTFIAASTDIGLKPYGLNNVIIGTSNFYNTNGNVDDAQADVSYSSIIGSSNISVRKKVGVRQLSSIGTYTASIGADDNAANMSQVSFIGCQNPSVNGNVTGLSIFGSYGVSVDAALDSTIAGSSSLSCGNLRYTDISGTFSSTFNNIDQGLIAASVSSNIESSKTTFSRQFFGFGLNNHWIENTTQLSIFGGGGNIKNANHSFLTHSFSVNVENATSLSMKFSSSYVYDSSLVDIIASSGTTVRRAANSKIEFTNVAKIGSNESTSKSIKNVDVIHSDGVNIQASHVSANHASPLRLIDTIGANIEGPAELNTTYLTGGVTASDTNPYVLSANRYKYIMTGAITTDQAKSLLLTNSLMTNGIHQSMVGNNLLTIPKNTIWFVEARLIVNPGRDNITDYYGTTLANCHVASSAFVVIHDENGNLMIPNEDELGLTNGWFKTFATVMNAAANASDMISVQLMQRGSNGLEFEILLKKFEDMVFNRAFCTLHLDICENVFNYDSYYAGGDDNMQSMAT
jgi:hypothetical protein